MLVKLAAHFVVSIFLGIVVFALTKNVTYAMLIFAGGFFPDVDHLLDYGLYTKGKTFDWNDLVSGSFFKKYKCAIIPLHSIELIPILFVIGIWTNYLIHIVFLSLGFLIHILLDYYAYPVKPGMYFFTYRLKHKFQLNLLSEII